MSRTVGSKMKVPGVGESDSHEITLDLVIIALTMQKRMRRFGLATIVKRPKNVAAAWA
ncbi:unnamed protein product [Ceratitis capitata]|uniref:(Mediterranean fruit fly) hypothetical protein n=1 Tax=Ceratitis capitata TaxID=7213 RepID=A0A811V011_CERCA|nr:unnamed protein product [Ceratitis capitata]